jgi:hypothetical protein
MTLRLSQLTMVTVKMDGGGANVVYTLREDRSGQLPRLASKV